MLLYLVRHGEANNELADPSQALSQKGVSDVRKLASHLAAIKTSADIIFHSRKLRAKQTANIIAEFLKPAEGVVETDHLDPLDDPSEWGKILRSGQQDIMLVGHLPYIAKLFCLLTCGFIDDGAVTFRNASAACLKRESDDSWRLQWMLGPEVVGEITTHIME
ncbi:MAG TPA: phosphohistidine phosphatase SixA [Dissulfurispiraceae bacterium]|nr:phosphohistidine phosphatase SixA [Dissulfurispiraceae bacterium]